VIAIENVRLFNETKEALERQDGNRRNPEGDQRVATDVRPVLEAVASSAARLCRREGRRGSC
jgi:hypothetical protein